MALQKKEKIMQSRLPSFDTMVDMARHNPDALEQLRLREVEAIIESAPPHIQRRLRGLQFQIDSQRKIHPSAMGACIKISEMMHESFSRLRHLLSHIAEPSQNHLPCLKESSNAKILEFPQS